MLEALGKGLAAAWRPAVEILILAAVLYFAYRHLQRTTGARILTAVGVVFVTLLTLSEMLDLAVISWLLKGLPLFLGLALIVIFQPELRRALTELGSHPFFGGGLEKRETVKDLVDAAFALSGKGYGALLAIERDISLKPFEETGVALDALLTHELLLTIFHPKTVLHDGAAIIHHERVAAAGCILPLSQREDLDRNLGLRHRAALGLTEDTDAVAIVVSEETGQVSVCHGGMLERNLSREKLAERLENLLLHQPAEENFPRGRHGESRMPDSGGGALAAYPPKPAAKPPEP